MTDQSIIKPENKIDNREELSPSGKYKLVISQFKTKDADWNYCSGKLVRLSDNKEIVTINRNYSQFHHSWFIKNNHEWLQTGSTYMSQTFIDLDTGFIYDNTEKLSKTKDFQQGSLFCWTKSWISNDGNTLMVLGCYWTCSYQYKFYDFSTPGKGWEQLKEDGEYWEMGNKTPHFNEDGTITIYDCKQFIQYKGKLIDGNSEEYFLIPDTVLCDPKNLVILDDQIRTLKRQGNKIVTLKLWQSNDRKKEEELLKKHDDERKAEDKKILEESDIYKKLIIELKKTKFNIALNWSYDNNHKHFMVNVSNYKNSDKIQDHMKKACNIKWGVKTGSIYVEYLTEKEGVRHKQEFKRKIELIDEILVAIKDYL